MRVKIIAKEIDTVKPDDGNGKIRILGIVNTDSLNRALDLYKNDMREDERMEYEIMPDKIPVQLRLTQQEYDMLLSQANSKGLKLAAYLRSLIYVYEHSK